MYYLVNIDDKHFDIYGITNIYIYMDIHYKKVLIFVFIIIITIFLTLFTSYFFYGKKNKRKIKPFNISIRLKVKIDGAASWAPGVADKGSIFCTSIGFVKGCFVILLGNKFGFEAGAVKSYFCFEDCLEIF